MLTVWVFLPEEHDFDLDDIESLGTLQDALEAKMHSPIVMTVVKRRIPRPMTVVLGELHDAA